MITVALIDDHLIVRSGFAQLLGLEPDLQVVAEFGSGREALAGLPGRGVQVCICATAIAMPWCVKPFNEMRSWPIAILTQLFTLKPTGSLINSYCIFLTRKIL